MMSVQSCVNSGIGGARACALMAQRDRQKSIHALSAMILNMLMRIRRHTGTILPQKKPDMYSRRRHDPPEEQTGPEQRVGETEERFHPSRTRR